MLRSNDCWRVQVTAKWINILLWTIILQLMYDIPFIHDHCFLGFWFVCIILEPNVTMSLGYWWVLPFKEEEIFMYIAPYMQQRGATFMPTFRDSWGSLHSVGLWDNLRWKRKNSHTQRIFPVCLHANISILMFYICILLILQNKSLTSLSCFSVEGCDRRQRDSQLNPMENAVIHLY